MVESPIYVLVVDDDDEIRNLCATIVSNIGYVPLVASSGQEARAILSERKPDLVLLDLRLPDGDGTDILKEIKSSYPGTEVIIMTAYGTIRSAVAAMKQGAYHYITKPFSTRDMMMLLKDAARGKSGNQPVLPEPALLETEGFHGIIGVSVSMRKIYKLILKLGDVDSTVLIQGESGTGKELVARAIHACGTNAREPFIPIDCNILNENVIESELFGHVRGAFTGAMRDREGLFKVAGEGTVFLDEISEIPLEIQTKLLRAIQEREMKPVGSTRTIKFDARIIAATQRDLEAQVKKGGFREDLFYRLNVIPITIPPLRYRKEDIPVLVQHFIRTFGAGKKTPQTITDAALAAIIEYDWPGNVRELENCIEQVVALSSSPVIDVDDLPVRITRREAPHTSFSGAKSLRELEREGIIAALHETGGNRRHAARLLGIAESTLYLKLKEMKLDSSVLPSPRHRKPTETT
jgi:two-component system response regulator HydG